MLFITFTKLRGKDSFPGTEKRLVVTRWLSWYPVVVVITRSTLSDFWFKAQVTQEMALPRVGKCFSENQSLGVNSGLRTLKIFLFINNVAFHLKICRFQQIFTRIFFWCHIHKGNAAFMSICFKI